VNPSFAAIAETWHDFYLTAGAASATLVGLLFVGLSLNLDVVTSDEGTSIRVLAEQAFADFVFVLLIALFVLIPNQDAQSMTVELGIIGAFGTFRVVRRWSLFRRPADRFLTRRYLIRRLGLPGLASVGLILVGLWFPSQPLSAFFWLLGIVLLFLMSAADSCWDLLVEVGLQRRVSHG
jgi:hypothetical protein